MSKAGTRAGVTAGRRSRTPSADIQRELVAAAESVLVRDGPAGVTVRAVAAEAGIAPMGVYSRLGGKDGLVNALLLLGFGRLTATMQDSRVADPLGRLRDCARRYREFALASPHFYAVMFERAIPRERDAEPPREVVEQAAAAFGALVRVVELAAAAGAITAPDATEVAQQVWNAVHGAVALELKGLILTPDPAVTYQASVETLIRGLSAGQPR